MFTGIIEPTAQIIKKDKNGITVERPAVFSELARGQSIAVNGACLSVVEYSAQEMRFDVVPETFSRTNLGGTHMANLERALPANGRFEGHFVAGHIDGIVKLLRRQKEERGEKFEFELPADSAHLFVEKGSVALNGVSLTLAAVSKNSFAVAVIPLTLEKTNLGKLREDDAVNFEADVLGKYLYKWFQKKAHS